MNGQNAVILDGSREGEDNVTSIIDMVRVELEHSGIRVKIYRPRDCRLAHCIGCFRCWLETPGICREDDDGREIAASVIHSDLTVLISPLTFGGYSSDLKRAMERLVPLALPFFKKYYGEIHHIPRYSKRPRLVAIGVQQRDDPESAHLFKAIVARNALNIHAESHAAEVINSAENPEVIRWMIRSLLSRNDSLRFGPGITVFQSYADASRPAATTGSRHALLIVGSPKTLSASTSGVLGEYLVNRLQEHGWSTETITLRASLRRANGQSELLTAVDRADLLLFVFPLYVDTLPFLMTKTLELIADHRRATAVKRPQSLVAVSNNGFPEPYQNAPALAICRRFAAETGITWAGGLALGAGEAISSGVPLTGNRSGLPPAKHVMEALDLTAAALAAGRPVPEEAVQLMARNPIPFLPFAAWRWIYMWGGSRSWNQKAAQNGVTREAMFARPYADRAARR